MKHELPLERYVSTDHVTRYDNAEICRLESTIVPYHHRNTYNIYPDALTN